MKKKLIYISLFLAIFLSIKLVLFADDLLEKTWFELYEERVDTICGIKNYIPEKKIYETEDYKETNTQDKNEMKEKLEEYSQRIEYLKLNFDVITDEEKEELKELQKIIDSKEDWYNALSIAKETYENNMNNIYKCAILTTQLSTLKLVKNDILPQSNNPDLSKEIWNEIDSQIKKIGISIDSVWCKNKNDNNSVQKLDILKQTTYELCKYHSYLEYLREYNSNYENLIVNSDEEDFNSMYLVNLEKYRKQEIDDEIEKVYKVYPIAFNAYKEYENNLLNHILLNLVENDYVVLRENLHKVLNPINQVVYKISNAMQDN